MADRYASLKQGLVGAWIPSISGSGLLLPDLSGRGNNGVLTNMDASDWVSASYGRALDFDGVDDYVTSAAYYDAGSLSFSFWAYFSGTPANYPMILQWRRPSQANATQSMQVLFRPTGDVFGGSTPDSASGNRISFTINGATTATTHPFFAMTANTWQHWAGTYDGSNLRLFNSGVLRMTVAGSFANTAGEWNVDIANNRVSPSDGYFKGQLDDIRIYNRALTEAEIKLLSSEPGIGFKRSTSAFSTRYTYQPPKAKVFEGVRVRDHDYSSLRNGLVGAWCPSLPNGGSGNTLPDVSGYGNHGTLTNMSPDDWVSSQYGRALDFDGSDDFVAISDTRQWHKSDFSFACFANFRTNGENNYGTVFSRDNGGTNWVFFSRDAFSSSGNMRVNFYDGSNNPSAQSNTVLNLSTWYHVAFTVLGNTATVYVNGKSEASASISSWTRPTINDIQLGRWNLNNGRTMDGAIDDAKLYARALTASEISRLASRRGIGLQPSPTKFIAREKKTGLRRKILTGQT